MTVALTDTAPPDPMRSESLPAGRIPFHKRLSGSQPLPPVSPDPLHYEKRNKLRQELYRMAEAYVVVEGGDERRAIEAMCDDFFRVAGECCYPNGGWGGLLLHAMKAAG